MAAACPGEQTLPFSELMVTVGLGEIQDRAQAGEIKTFEAYADITNATLDGKVSCKTQFLHLGFPHNRKLTERDIKALLEVSKAAEKGKALRMNIGYRRASQNADDKRSVYKHFVTTYRSALKRGTKEDWVITVTQNKKTHELSEAELKKFRKFSCSTCRAMIDDNTKGCKKP